MLLLILAGYDVVLAKGAIGDRDIPGMSILTPGLHH